MAKTDDYRAALRALPAWDDYLLAESRLPGPRGNLELLEAAVLEGEAANFRRWASLGADAAPTNTPGEFLAACGIVGLGRLLAEGDNAILPALRSAASDPRWRVREAVAMGLQRLGDVDMRALLAIARDWCSGSPLERRAAIAAVCEPRLLRDERAAVAVLGLLDDATADLAGRQDRRSDDVRVLRQALGYCWSVAVVAAPDEGRPMIERWCRSADPVVRAIMRENLAKHRLARLDPDWVRRRLDEVRAGPV